MTDMKELYDNDPDMLKAEIARLRAQTNRLGNEADAARTRVKELEHGVERLRAERTSYKSSWDGDVKALKARVEVLEAENLELRKTKASEALEKENAELRNKLEWANREVNLRQSDREQQANLFQVEADRLRLALKSWEIESGNDAKKIESLRGEVQTAMHAQGFLLKQIEALKAKLAWFEERDEVIKQSPSYTASDIAAWESLNPKPEGA